MDASTSNYSYLILKIEEFIRKYYLNQVVRGSLYLSASLIASYILIALAEYFGNFSPLVRTLLFYSFLTFNGFVSIKWIAIPLLQYYKLGKTLTHEKASEIIGQHFSHIKDKLLNTLQLKKLANENLSHKELVEASIDQKIAELKPIPFTTAIKIKDNKRYLKYVLFPLVILVFIGATAPSILKESTERLIKHNKKFIREAPFKFLILNKDLSVVKGEDFILSVKIIGQEIPQDIYLEDGANLFKLNKENILNFNYTFRNVQDEKKIVLKAGEFKSTSYTIQVKKNPSLLNFDVYLEYPEYINKRNENFSNSGDLSVPAGTKVSWKFKTENTSQIRLTSKDQKIDLGPQSKDIFIYTFRALESAVFSVKASAGSILSKEETHYNLNVIPDLSPQIQINERKDSLNSKVLYFVGQVNDDYGFSKLDFIYKVSDEHNKGRIFRRAVSFNKNVLQSNFFYAFDVSTIKIKAGDRLEYYFEVFDNDAVNGPKSTRSSLKSLKLPTNAETQKQLEQTAKIVEKKMEQAIKQASAIEREAKRLNQDLFNKKSLSFEEKKQIEQLLDKQRDLQKLVDEIKNDNKKNLYQRQELGDETEQLLEKQKQIENLFENVLDEKTKELLKNIEQLLDQNNKGQTQQELSKMQTDNKVLQKELDRILELYKQLEFDQKLNEVTKKIDKLAEKQQQLKEKTQKNDSSKDLQRQQEQLNKEFNEVKTDMKDLERKNEELDKKNELQNTSKEQEQIEENLEESSKNLENKNNKKAAEKQEQAAQQMKQLSQKLSDNQKENELEENQLNLQNLRQILKNLLSASFNQEKIMQTLRSTSSTDPNYLRLTQKQKEIKDDLKGVQDSLFELSKKAPQIESLVNKEIQEINKNIESALNHLSERRTPEANRNQQYAMTAINNLALMLSEVEDALQRMMKNAQQGGKGKQKSLSQLRQMQEQLNQNMQKARQQMQQQGIQAAKGFQSKGQMSEQLARMAREQQMIRQSLQEINRDLNKDGKGGLGNLDKLAKEMEQSETDLVNKKIQQETLIRQQEILSKLLNAEKAEREREQDNKRESKQGKEYSPSYKFVLDEFKKIKQNEVELLKTVPPDLNSFYKLKVGDYFRLLNSNQ
ncbi:DUF4175 family protein [Desertivirga arenae]|uniref:DUF4175 family protein n=1 Tax=Desertivirga arenae TaxID=2810309 RepID=UPI001A961E6F|nr:DUF4175 family protein [Pedobacter sp. SYSU D00823]